MFALQVWKLDIIELRVEVVEARIQDADVMPFSTEVSAFLYVEDRQVAIAKINRDYLTLAEVCEISPGAEADLHIFVNKNKTSMSVLLNDVRFRLKTHGAVFGPCAFLVVHNRRNMHHTKPGFAGFARDASNTIVPTSKRLQRCIASQIRRALAKEIDTKHRIYLDTKFWILFADASRGKAVNKSDVELLNLLRNLKARQTLVCPVSYSSIHELWLQNDATSRRVTAEVMDELSDLLACLQPPHVLFDMELWHLLYSAIVTATPEPFIKCLVWTKVGYYLGEPTLKSEAIPDDAAQVIQKCVDDSLFESTLVEMVDELSKGQRPPMPDRERLATDLTIGKNQNPGSSFSELYRQEIVGGLEVHHESCCEVMANLCNATGLAGHADAAERDRGGRMVRGLIESALRAGRVQSRFPQLHINASLHAALRWDNRRTYKRGDCEDFRHVGSALPYCDYFSDRKKSCASYCATNHSSWTSSMEPKCFPIANQLFGVLWNSFRPSSNAYDV